MQDRIKKVLELSLNYPDDFVCTLILGDNVFVPAKSIRDVEFQFVGDDGQILDFEFLTTRIATAAHGVCDFDRFYEDGGWIGRCAYMTDAQSERTYMAGLRLRGRPRTLKIRLSEKGGDDCDVNLSTIEGYLVTGVATGTSWQEWQIK